VATVPLNRTFETILKFEQCPEELKSDTTVKIIENVGKLGVINYRAVSLTGCCKLMELVK
jgi:hypothetical protein